MKNYQYTVEFVHHKGLRHYYCQSFNQAIILATAHMIQEGLNSEIKSITDEKGNVATDITNQITYKTTKSLA